MQNKSIELIQSEVASDLGYRSWGDLSHSSTQQRWRHDEAFRMVAKRYASQSQTNSDPLITEIMVLKERVVEIEGLLIGIAKSIEKGENIGGVNLLTTNSVGYDSIKRLINKGNDNE